MSLPERIESKVPIGYGATVQIIFYPNDAPRPRMGNFTIIEENGTRCIASITADQAIHLRAILDKHIALLEQP